MPDTSTAGNSRQRLRQLIDDLLSRARRASCETESLGRLVGETYCLDVRKARSAAAYLKELGLVGDAVRLPKDVGHLRRHAREVFQRSISPRTEPHDLEQAQRDLESLNSEASRLVVFLRELESFCVNEYASPTPTPAQPKRRRRKTDSDRQAKRAAKREQEKTDKRLWDAWAGGHGKYRTLVQLAREVSSPDKPLNPIDVRRGLDRHRKRLERSGKRKSDKRPQ